MRDFRKLTASSIPTNIAEGCGRNGDTELARFMNIALGFEKLTADVVEVKRMLTAFTQRLTAER